MSIIGDDFLRTILDELEADGLAGLPAPGGCDLPDDFQAIETREELNHVILRYLREVVGEYAVVLGQYRWWRRNRPGEFDLPWSPRKMSGLISQFSRDPVLGRAHADAIVRRVGELVG